MLVPPARLAEPIMVALPEGYVLRTYEEGDGPAYIALMNRAGFEAWNEETFAQALRRALPDGLFFVVHTATDALVATAVATHNPSDLHPAGGELGWVAGHPDHAGKGLGMAVCAAVIERYRNAGYTRIYLKTDDWRLAAIKVYLKLGLVPFLTAPDISDRWQAICEKLNWAFTPDAWPARDRPEPAPDLRPDSDRPDRYRRRHLWLPDRPHKGYSSSGDVDAFGDESLYKPSLLGRAYAEPTVTDGGEMGRLAVAFVAGPAGAPEGARVTFVMRGQSPLGRGSEFVEIDGPDTCTLELERAGFLVKAGNLVEGDEVVLTTDAFPWTPLAGRREFKVVINHGDGRPEQRLPEPVVVETLARGGARLELILPCTFDPMDACMDARVRFGDGYGNPLFHNGPVKVSCGGLDYSVTMQRGLASAELDADADPVVRATARIGDGPEAVSNPCVESEAFQCFVGDLHAHDFLSEAEGYPDDVYRWARDDRRLDFVSVVPQSHGWHDNQTWTICKSMNERFLEEGRFVTFLGFEWQHTAYGDKVVHYLGGDQPVLPVDDERSCSAPRLYGLLRQSDALVIAHHPCYPAGSWCSSTDWDAVETDVERLAELWSMHGSSEGWDETDRPLRDADPSRTVMAALRQGVRVGFVAGSDTHSGRPGGSAKEPRPHWGGLAAVWAKDLTRRSLFEALRARRTCALTQARIVLRMTVNGAWMGSEIPAADSAEIRIDAWAPGDIEKVEIVRNAALLKTLGPFGDECHVEFEDAPDGPAFYHCRVTQTDGHLAVCSPVWVG